MNSANEKKMIGTWDVFLDWKNSGDFFMVKVTFMRGDEVCCVTPALPHPNPTPQTLVGKWAQRDGMVIWGYNTETTRFSGVVNGHTASGIMCTFSGMNTCGTWYALRSVES